jgi:hypothetical protein
VTAGPWSLAWRLALAFVGACAIIVGLELRLRTVAAAEVVGTDRGAAPAAPPEAAEPAPRLDLGVHVEAVALCAGNAACPPDAAPVVEVHADARVAVRRPPPLPAAPDQRAFALGAVVLPVPSLRALSPEQRAAVLDVLSRLLARRPVAAERVRLCGVEGSRDEVALLLGWLR